MTELCQQIMAKMSLVKAENGPFLFKEARLIDAQGDLSKQWLIDFSVWSEQQQKLVRKRYTVPGKSAQERYRTAVKLIKELNRLMRSGKGLVVEALPSAKSLLTKVHSVDPATELVMSAPLDGLTLTASSALTDVIAYYLSIKKQTLSRNSYETYDTCANKFKIFLGAKGMGKIRVGQFTHAYAFAYQDWLIHAGLANKTINKLTEFIEGVFQFVKGRKIIKANPFGDLVSLPTTSGRHVPFLAEQVIQLKQYLLADQPDPQLWLFVNMIYYTCSRPHEEVRFIQVRDVERKTLMIYGDRSKNNRSNPKPIAPPLEALIQQYNIRSYPPHFYIFGPNGLPGEKHMGEKYFYKKHRAMLDALEFPAGYHDLYGWKHTGVIALYQKTKDIRLIQRMCGHQHIATTEIYLRDLGLFLSDNELDGIDAI